MNCFRCRSGLCAKLIFRPFGAWFHSTFLSHGLRRGLHSGAAPRLQANFEFYSPPLSSYDNALDAFPCFFTPALKEPGYCQASLAGRESPNCYSPQSLRNLLIFLRVKLLMEFC
jgi:hypothetical protein